MTKQTRNLGFGLLASLAVIGGVLCLRHDPAPRKQLAARRPKKAAFLPTSKTDLMTLVETNKTNPDKQIQDRVGAARIRLGYLAAGKKDWPAARATFQLAAKEYKGTGAMSADFGGVPDQAAYQAAVCLVPEGKTEEAEAEFIRFMKERPYSPLAKAAFKRLVRLNHGVPKPEWEIMLQVDVSKQEARVRFETSVCGPKSIEYTLGLLKKNPLSYQEIAKLCDTKDSGTTVAGMRKGLQAMGIDSYAYKLNRQDLARAPIPAILLDHDHYVTLTKIDGNQAIVYDTRFREEQMIKLPPIDDPDYSISAILFSPLESR